MDKEKISAVAKTLMFEVNEQVVTQLEIEYDNLERKIKELKMIDVSNVEPLIYVDNSPTDFLRNDDEPTILDQTIILKNAPQKAHNYIVLPRVITDE